MLAAVLLLALFALTTGGALIGSAVVARHRAAAAADLAALSAATRLPAGPDAACAAAESVASAMDATVTGCDPDGLDVIVATEAALRLGGWLVGPARAAARAGPAAASEGFTPA